MHVTGVVLVSMNHNDFEGFKVLLGHGEVFTVVAKGRWNVFERGGLLMGRKAVSSQISHCSCWIVSCLWSS